MHFPGLFYFDIDEICSNIDERADVQTQSFACTTPLALSISPSPPHQLSNSPNDAAFQPCSLILSPASFKWRFYILFISGACIIFLERSINIVQFFGILISIR